MFFKRKKSKIKIISDKKKDWDKKRKTPSSFKLSRVFFYLLGIIFLGTIIYLLFFSMFLSINSVEVGNTEKVDAKQIKMAFEEKISGKFLWSISKDNLLLINENSLKKYLMNKFNRIEDVEIQKKFPDKIMIFIKEKQFKLIFLTGGKQYLIDENGKAWSKGDFNLEENEENNLAILKNESDKAPESGNNVLKTDFMDYIMKIKEGVQSDAGIELSNNFYSPRLISRDLYVETKNGWKIYFNQDIDVQKSIEILKSVLFENIKKEDISNLEYLDLRINNKVYYKLKNTEKTTENSSSKNLESKEK